MTTVFLADDHAVLREGLQVLIDAQADMTVVGSAGDGREAVRRVRECQPDVVVMDVSMPGLDGVRATEQIRRECPRVRVLALTRHAEHGYVRRLMTAGAGGYVLKKAAADELIQAIRTVAAGGTYIDATLTPLLAQQAAGGTGRALHARPLTDRETEVLRRIAQGFSNKEIAAHLGISVKTVEYHKARSAEKLELRSRADIVRHAIAEGWLQEDG